MTLADAIHAAFHEPATRLYRVVQGTVWVLIVLSVSILVAESFLPATESLPAPLQVADRMLLAVFAVEYLLRIASFRPPSLEVFHPGRFITLRTHIMARLRFAMQPLNLVDLLAVITLFPELRGLRALRLLRLLRTLRVFRYANPFASITRAFEENSLLFVFGFTVLVSETLLGGVTVYFVEKAANPAINTPFDGIWWALVTITTVGFGDITPITPLGRIIGGVLMIGGMFTLAMFAGFVGSSLVHAIVNIREEQFRMGEYVNHVVVLGYDATSEFLLGLVGTEFDTEETRVVVFEDQERPRELPANILWVQGDPTKQSELDKVRLTHARAAVVVGLRHVTPQIADARAILTTFTVRSYMKERESETRHRRNPLYIVTEILDAENVNHARSAGADEVVETRRVGFSMIAHAVRYKGTADAMSEVLLAGSYNVYVGKIPGGLRKPVPYSALLVELQLTNKGALVIGLQRPDHKTEINPARDRMVQPGTYLVYLAEVPVLQPPD